MNAASTLKDLLTDTCSRYPGQTALLYKQAGEWRRMTYARLLERTHAVSLLLTGRGRHAPRQVGIFLENRPQWAEIYFGIAGSGMTAVPVDAKLREQEVAHILRDSGCRTVFASAKTYRVIREAEHRLPDLARVILVDAEDLLPLGNGRTDYVAYENALADAEEKAKGGDTPFAGARPQPDDVASIIYTSGTTGRQKGAMLTHGNFCVNVAACLRELEVGPADSFLLVLPLHHSFAFTANLLLPVAAGAGISLVESLKTVSENIREVRPTVVIGVPLLIEKMYARIRENLRRRPLAAAMFAAGLRGPVRKRIRAGLGGKIRLLVVGGAPSSPDVIKGFARFGVPVLEGYGLTETAPVLTLNPLGRPKPGTVGRALDNVEIRIDEPNAEGVGEILARGPNIMPGYYNDREATEEVLKDGWFSTGDLGRLDEEGYLTITGRKKSLIVNREGKNIYPEEVEQQIAGSPYVLEAIVLGYTVPGETGERVGAIVVPNLEAIDAHEAHRRGPADPARAESLVRKEVSRAVSTLADYKRPRRIQIRTEEFEKTSTGKIKRYLYAISPTEI